MKHVLALAISAVLLASASVAQAQSSSEVIVNRQPLSTDQVQILEWYYGVDNSGGAYWYDPLSGLWGTEGGASTGQIAPGLPLGGPLRSDASNGHSGVFFNGRQLAQSEVDYLRGLFGTAPPGRYWLDASGTGGPEGASATFSLARGGSSSTGGASSSTNSGATSPGGSANYPGNTNRNAFGAYGSDGNCYYVAVDGGDVLGPGC